jgi:hypothetical protein
MLCTELAQEERCNGCPLNEYGRALQPHEELAFTTEVATVLSNQDPDVTPKAFADQMSVAMMQMEPAVRKIAWLVQQVASWRLIGECEHHTGTVIYDPEGDRKREEAIASYFAKVIEKE